MYPCLTHMHRLPDSGGTAASHSEEPTVGYYPPISFFGAIQNTGVLKHQKHQPRLRIPSREPDISGIRENSQKPVLRSVLRSSMHLTVGCRCTLTPKRQVAILATVREEVIRTEGIPCSTAVPTVQTFQEQKASPVPRYAHGKTLMEHPLLNISLDDPLSKRQCGVLGHYRWRGKKRL